MARPGRYDDAILMAVSFCSGVAVGFFLGFTFADRIA